MSNDDDNFKAFPGEESEPMNNSESSSSCVIDFEKEI